MTIKLVNYKDTDTVDDLYISTIKIIKIIMKILLLNLQDDKPKKLDSQLISQNVFVE